MKPKRCAVGTVAFSAMVCFSGVKVLAGDPHLPRTFTSDASILQYVRLNTTDPTIAPAMKSLTAEADRALTEGPYAVTDKKQKSFTGDPHDYISLAPYYWPNPDTKDGLPYVRHDGRRNPEIKDYDAGRFGAMSGRSYTLALAYFLTGKEAYADRAALLLRTWFLDPSTKMNPNMDHAQLVRGANDGRGTGIIESDRLLGVVDAVGLLRDSTAWTKGEQNAMEAWFSDFLKWMRESKNGKAEAAAKNNHGTWYDVQVMTYAMFIGDYASAKSVAEEAKVKRIAVQVQPDGSLPLELTRTNSLGYSVFDVNAFAQLADLARVTDVDLWRFKTPDGRSIPAAIDYLLPYVLGEKKWEHEQIGKFDAGGFRKPLYRAFAATRNPRYKAALAKLQAEDSSSRDVLLFFAP